MSGPPYTRSADCGVSVSAAWLDPARNTRRSPSERARELHTPRRLSTFFIRFRIRGSITDRTCIVFAVRISLTPHTLLVRYTSQAAAVQTRGASTLEPLRRIAPHIRLHSRHATPQSQTARTCAVPPAHLYKPRTHPADPNRAAHTRIERTIARRSVARRPAPSTGSLIAGAAPVCVPHRALDPSFATTMPTPQASHDAAVSHVPCARARCAAAAPRFGRVPALHPPQARTAGAPHRGGVAGGRGGRRQRGRLMVVHVQPITRGAAC